MANSTANSLCFQFCFPSCSAQVILWRWRILQRCLISGWYLASLRVFCKAGVPSTLSCFQQKQGNSLSIEISVPYIQQPFYDQIITLIRHEVEHGVARYRLVPQLNFKIVHGRFGHLRRKVVILSQPLSGHGYEGQIWFPMWAYLYTSAELSKA